MKFGGMTDEDTMRSMRLFAKEVMRRPNPLSTSFGMRNHR